MLLDAEDAVSHAAQARQLVHLRVARTKFMDFYWSHRGKASATWRDEAASDVTKQQSDVHWSCHCSFVSVGDFHLQQAGHEILCLLCDNTTKLNMIECRRALVSPLPLPLQCRRIPLPPLHVGRSCSRARGQMHRAPCCAPFQPNRPTVSHCPDTHSVCHSVNAIRGNTGEYCSNKITNCRGFLSRTGHRGRRER